MNCVEITSLFFFMWVPFFNRCKVIGQLVTVPWPGVCVCVYNLFLLTLNMKSKQTHQGDRKKNRHGQAISAN